MTLDLSFLGGAGTVTGSKYLLEVSGKRVMVDCGLFQGFKQLRLRNRASLPVPPQSIDAVLLTHAHIDHSGYLPLLVKHGFHGKVFCTEATRALCGILLPDSGFLQEKDADFANRHGFSKHHPALPLYTRRDALAALENFRPVPFDKPVSPVPGFEVTFRRAGHILGAASLEIECAGRKIVFSGDLGRFDSPTMADPAAISDADYLIMESTYGDRLHASDDPEDLLAEIVGRTAERGGTVVIPSFAVGRVQILLFHLNRLKENGRIPNVPIFLDSPMAVQASDIFERHPTDHRLTESECRKMHDAVRYVSDVEESKSLDTDPMPKIIISASGMATGGRVLHHLKAYAPDPRSFVLFAGFQAGGTRGDAMVRGEKEIKIHGSYIPIRAEVDNLHVLSAHADQSELLSWLANFRKPPIRTFVTHGEPNASDVLRHRIEEEFGWDCVVPEHMSHETLA